MKVDYKRFPVTMISILICIIVYVYTSMLYGLSINAYQGQMAGGFNPALVLDLQQYYRILTANFIHFDLMHIVCNCYALYGLGMILENILKSKKFFIVFFGSMLATTLIPCVLYIFWGVGATSIMGGISGAIFGIMGALLALGVFFKERYRSIFQQVVSNVLIMLVISIALPSISLTGHVSGLIGGFVIMTIIIKFFPISTWKKKETVYQGNNLVN